MSPVIYSYSDWAGCSETRRSTDSHMACLGGTVVAVTTRTQPDLPATSSRDAELRGTSRAAREAPFIHGLVIGDFGLPASVPFLWFVSSAALTASKRISPGSKLKHLKVYEFYVRDALQAGKIQVCKVKGTPNPGAFLTKHAKCGPQVFQTFPPLGIVDVRDIVGSTAATRSTVKTCQSRRHE